MVFKSATYTVSMVVIFLLAPSVQSVGYLLTSFLDQRKMRYVIVLRGQPFSITHVDHFQAHFLKALLSKLLMKQTVRSQLIDVTESIASGNLESS